MNIELKPCPFCGGEANTIQTRWSNNRWYTCCPSCDTINGLLEGYDIAGRYETEAEAAEAWNTRAERTCHDESGGDPCAFVCSQCGSVRNHPEDEPVAYCPNCGAKVVEE